MKILKEGVHKAWTAKVTCRGKNACGAVLLAERSDLIYFCRQGYDYLGDANGDELIGIKCPTCGKMHEIKDAPTPERK